MARNDISDLDVLTEEVIDRLFAHIQAGNVNSDLKKLVKDMVATDPLAGGGSGGNYSQGSGSYNQAGGGSHTQGSGDYTQAKRSIDQLINIKDKLTQLSGDS